MKTLKLTLILVLLTTYSFAQNPCNCDSTWDEENICVSDSVGNTFIFFNNPCLLDCLNFTPIDSSLCSIDSSEVFCDCPLDMEQPFICAIDAEGTFHHVPNECFANCLGFTIVSEDSCHTNIEIDLDFNNILCLLEIDISNINFIQDWLLIAHAQCEFELSSCIIDAPNFNNDSLFLNYILSNCNCGGIIDDIADIYEERNLSSSNKDVKLHSLFIYPNPANESIRIGGVQFLDVKPANYKILNLDGKTLINGIITSQDSFIDLQSLINGTYILSIENEKEAIVTKFYKL
jgi:hypothetical protein